MMKYADHHKFPIITFVDTPGAFADLKSEELGQVCVHNLFVLFCQTIYSEYHKFTIFTLQLIGPLMQGEAIAQNLRTMFGFQVPIVSVVTGEGGSGGALAIACANKLFMLENSAFYVARLSTLSHFFPCDQALSRNLLKSFELYK